MHIYGQFTSSTPKIKFGSEIFYLGDFKKYFKVSFLKEKIASMVRNPETVNTRQVKFGRCTFAYNNNME
jgi:hypothetical protein